MEGLLITAPNHTNHFPLTERIDDDAFEHGIHFVKCNSVEFAKELDITRLPSLVYFENEKPSIYTEDLEDEDAVLNWLVTVGDRSK